MSQMHFTETQVAQLVTRAVAEERDSLRNLIADLSAALTDEGPDWSFDGVANLRRRVVEALPGDERIAWLEPYVADGI